VFFGLISFFNGCAMAKTVIAGLSPRAHELDPRLVNVVFVVDRVALEQVFLPVLRFSSVTIIAPFLHILVFIYMLLLSEGRTGEGWEPSNSNIISEIAGHRTEGASDLSMLSSVK
jgi:hypothetical protein